MKVKVVLNDDDYGYLVFYLDLENEKVKELMEQYHKETENFAIWPPNSGVITEGFKQWLRGEIPPVPPWVLPMDRSRPIIWVQSDSAMPVQRTLEEDFLDFPNKFDELITFYGVLLTKIKEEALGIEILHIIETIET